MEFRKPPDEYALPPEEYALPDNEFYGQKPIGKAAADQKQSMLKRFLKMILMPAAAVLGSFSVLLAADGFDLFGTGEKTAAAETEAPTEQPSATEEVLSSEGPSESPETTAEPTPEPTPETTAVPTAVPTGDWDDEFPKLDNMTPDFEGNYAWSGEGSEEYVRILESGASDYSFVEMGSVWGTFSDASGTPYTVKTVEGASYDSTTNTLTLTDFTGDLLDLNLMGNGFTLRLEGDNHLGSISVWGAMYGGSLTITGPGRLTIDAGEDGVALALNCEASGSCIMIAGDATIEITGQVVVYDSTLEKALWFLMPIDLEGGTMQMIFESDGLRSFAILDEDGNPATHISFTPRWITEE